MAHSHAHIDNPRDLKIILFSFVVITLFMSAEFWAGYFLASVPLVNDAAHMSVDALSLLLALTALIIGSRPTTKRRRTEAVLALINGIALFAVCAYVLIEAAARFNNPYSFNSVSLGIAATGLAVNLAVARFILKTDRRRLNLQAAYLHVLGDMLGSIVAIVALLSLRIPYGKWLDVLVSLGVALFVLKNAVMICFMSYSSLSGRKTV